MIKKKIVYALVFVVLVLFLMRSQSNMCAAGQTTIKWGTTERCYAKGSYSNTSGDFPYPQQCTISGPNHVQAYYLTGYSNPTWNVPANQTKTRSCWPFSLKIT